MKIYLSFFGYEKLCAVGQVFFIDKLIYLTQSKRMYKKLDGGVFDLIIYDVAEMSFNLCRNALFMFTCTVFTYFYNQMQI